MIGGDMMNLFILCAAVIAAMWLYGIYDDLKENRGVNR
jgi:hypothetical protein